MKIATGAKAMSSNYVAAETSSAPDMKESRLTRLQRLRYAYGAVGREGGGGERERERERGEGGKGGRERERKCAHARAEGIPHLDKKHWLLSTAARRRANRRKCKLNSGEMENPNLQKKKQDMLRPISRKHGKASLQPRAASHWPSFSDIKTWPHIPSPGQA